MISFVKNPLVHWFVGIGFLVLSFWADGKLAVHERDLQPVTGLVTRVEKVDQHPGRFNQRKGLHSLIFWMKTIKNNTSPGGYYEVQETYMKDEFAKLEKVLVPGAIVETRYTWEQSIAYDVIVNGELVFPLAKWKRQFRIYYWTFTLLALLFLGLSFNPKLNPLRTRALSPT